MLKANEIIAVKNFGIHIEVPIVPKPRVVNGVAVHSSCFLSVRATDPSVKEAHAAKIAEHTRSGAIIGYSVLESGVSCTYLLSCASSSVTDILRCWHCFV